MGLRATLAAILGSSVAYAAGCDGLTCVASGGLAAVFLRIALRDLKLRVVDDRDTVILAAIGLSWTVWSHSDSKTELALTCVRMACYAATFQAIRLLFFYLRGREGLGFGDVKLIAAAAPVLLVDDFFHCTDYYRNRRHLFRSIARLYPQEARNISLSLCATWLYDFFECLCFVDCQNNLILNLRSKRRSGTVFAVPAGVGMVLFVVADAGARV